ASGARHFARSRANPAQVAGRKRPNRRPPAKIRIGVGRSIRAGSRTRALHLPTQDSPSVDGKILGNSLDKPQTSQPEFLVADRQELIQYQIWRRLRGEIRDQVTSANRLSQEELSKANSHRLWQHRENYLAGHHLHGW